MGRTNVILVLFVLLGVSCERHRNAVSEPLGSKVVVAQCFDLSWIAGDEQKLDGEKWVVSDDAEHGYCVIDANRTDFKIEDLSTKSGWKFKVTRSDWEYIAARWRAVYSQLSAKGLPIAATTGDVEVWSHGDENLIVEVFWIDEDEVALVYWSVIFR